MSSYDFSQEDDQREYSPAGPVPAGSIVIVRMEIIPPNAEYAAPGNRLIQLARSGLRMIYCQFTVSKGSYSGVSWRQTITLPQGMQNMNMSTNQLTACRIGGSLLKSILISTKKNLNVADLAVFNGLTFPVKVKINNKPSEYQGQTYWKNEIASVILPDNPQYQGIRQDQEYINEGGALIGTARSDTKGKDYQLPDSAFDNLPPSSYGRNKRQVDEVPF